MKILFLTAFALAFSFQAKAVDAAKAKEIFMKQKCQQCHAVKAASIALEKGGEAEEGDSAPDLSDVGKKVEVEWMKKFIRKSEKKEGKFHRKRFGGTTEELDVLCDWLGSLK